MSEYIELVLWRGEGEIIKGPLAECVCGGDARRGGRAVERSAGRGVPGGERPYYTHS